jgi:hypothetical protein
MVRLWVLLIAAGLALQSATTSTQPVRSDAQLEHNIKEKMAKSKIKADKFTFKVAGGVVTWEGQTNVAQHKGAATRMAKTAGAKGVVNNIKVSEAGKAKATEGLRKAQVKAAGAGQ